MARKKTQRAFALIAAITFLLSTLAFTGLVLWTMYQEGKTNNKEETSMTTQDSGGQTLKGTQLAGYEPVESVDSLQKIDLQEGSGEEVKPGATVTVHYTGALASNGTIFESSLESGQPVTFGLDQVIEGWGEGIPGMKVGSKRRLVIPAAQAYGEQSPSPDIPANSDLVFDVELIAVQ